MDTGATNPVTESIFVVGLNISFYTGITYSGQSRRGVKLTVHLHLLPMSRISGAILPLPHMPSRRTFTKCWINLIYDTKKVAGFFEYGNEHSLSLKSWNLSTSSENVSLSRMALLHGFG